MIIQIINDDCLNALKDIPDNSIDFILTDPPFGTTACKWDFVIPYELMWAELKRIRKDNTAILLFGIEPFSSHLRLSNLKEFKYDLIWNKNTSAAGLAKIRPMPNFEIISIFAKNKIYYNPIMEKGKPYKDNRNSNKRTHQNDHQYGYKKRIPIDNKGTRYPKSIINITKYNKKGQHPTQKPTELLEYLIKTYTKENEVVLDFTMGSGSTGVAAINTNRHFIGIELDKEYFKIAEKRINEASN
tara:strand:+ start:168 stop:896 length:729 start_codon:yes stop_codon:yes gene_type:complete